MRNGVELVSPQAGAMVKHGVDGSMELSVQAEVQAQALAAQAEADVKARWAIAQRVPRNIDAVRVKLLAECKRPGFAKAARYSKPVGKDSVTGPSIRFVEAALRCMGNVYCPTRVIREDALSRVLEVVVTDLEANTSWPRQITIRKTVERRGGKSGGAPADRTVVGERTNSYGEKVYEVVATEDELANKEAAAVSKAIRTAGLRVIPGDLVDEAMQTCVDVQQAVAAGELKNDPVTTRKRMVDAFLELGVRPESLQAYVGHPLEQLTPAELAELREVHNAIRDGEAKWADYMEARGHSTGQAAPPAAPSPAPATGQQQQPAPSAPAQAANAPSPEEVLLAEIEAASSMRELDALSKRASALPKGPGRDAVGRALSTRRNALKGA